MSAYKRLMQLIKPYWWKLALAMIFMGFVAACTSAVAFLIKPLLDEVFFNKNASMLKIIPGLVLVVYVAKGVFFYAQSYYMSYVGMTIVNDMRVALYSHMQKLSLSFFQRNSTGVLISRIT